MFGGRETVGIDNIRNLKKELSIKQSNPVVFLISDADRLTGPAQNSFLKLLEEPPPNVSFILGTNHRKNLLPTIESRCILIKMKQEINLCENEESTAKARQFLKGVSENLPGSINYKNTIKKDIKNDNGGLDYFIVWVGVLRDSLLLKLDKHSADSKRRVIFKDLEGEIANTFDKISIKDLNRVIKLGNKYYNWLSMRRVGPDRAAGAFLNQVANLCTKKKT